MTIHIDCVGAELPGLKSVAIATGQLSVIIERAGGRSSWSRT